MSAHCTTLKQGAYNIHISKFKPGTVEKNSSTIGPPAGIEPTPLRCRCNALATKLRR